METQNLKKQAIETISRLPDSVDFNEIVYELYVVEKVRKGLEAIENGDFITEKQLREQMKKW